METLIWYSIPGVILIATTAVIQPPSLESPTVAVGMAFLIPASGFVFHQAMRALFEGTGGFSRKSRTVLKHIKEWARTIRQADITNHDAFLVWEITFYGKEFPASFRDHDRGAWHYILSFWGVALVAVFAAATSLMTTPSTHSSFDG